MMQETGLLDLDVSCIQVTGKDSRDFLNRILTNDIKTLKPNQGSYNCICDRKGRILADLYCYAYQYYFRIHCARQLRDTIFHLLERYIIMEDVQLKALTEEGAFAIVGPASQTILTPFFPMLPTRDLSLS